MNGRWIVRILPLLVLACSSPRLSTDDKQEFDRTWRLYRAEDPTWPKARDAWLARGGEAKSVLIENLLADMVRTQSIASAGQAPPWDRPQRELSALGDDVLPYAFTTMSIRATDEVALDRCVELLVMMKAIEPTRAAYREAVGSSRADDAKEKRYRKALVRAAGRMEVAAGDELVIDALAKDPAWEIRATAATIIGGRPAPSRPMTDALVAAVGDPDWFVAAKAAEACGKLRLRAALASLVDLLDRATAATRVRECDAAVQALKQITGRFDLSSDPRAWRALLKTQS